MILLTLLTILALMTPQNHIPDVGKKVCAGYCELSENIGQLNHAEPERTNEQTDGVGSQDEPVGYVQKAEQFVEFGIIPSEIVEGFAEYDEEVIEWIASVAFCESRFNHLADNPTSYATGYFQYTPETFASYSSGDILALEGQFEAMKNMLDIYGFEVLRDSHFWQASRWCTENIQS